MWGQLTGLPRQAQTAGKKSIATAILVPVTDTTLFTPHPQAPTTTQKHRCTSRTALLSLFLLPPSHPSSVLSLSLLLLYSILSFSFCHCSLTVPFVCAVCKPARQCSVRARVCVCCVCLCLLDRPRLPEVLSLSHLLLVPTPTTPHPQDPAWHSSPTQRLCL